MKIEVFSAVPRRRAATPLLFVHGAFTSGRVFAEYFLPYFADQGYAAYALSLRGHGNSEGREALGVWRLADYVDDVASVVDDLPAAPVLIGHSMGGMVVQKYLEHHRAVRAVGLLASVPPAGLMPTMAGMSVSHPALVQQLGIVQMLGPQFSMRPMIGEALFCGSPADVVGRFFDGFQGESPLAVWDLLWADRLRLDPGSLDLPVIVMGAAHDPFVSTYGIRRTAEFYGVEPIVLDTGHMMMLDTQWQLAASSLLKEVEKALTGAWQDSARSTNVVSLF